MTHRLRLLLALVLSLVVVSPQPSFAKAAPAPAAAASKVNAQSVWVRGYTTKKGKVVKGYWRTRPNDTERDNYSAKGNRNPHTGKVGSKAVTH